ncbi:hypothetical protein OIE52_48810 [Streptomyces canus]|uniref:hypothetical protein n=1 Tax=Streptomyces canus TaxID=58343 RepID=UPI002E2CCC87|nr:hypothetical protein [Streptomyces canus]
MRIPGDAAARRLPAIPFAGAAPPGRHGRSAVRTGDGDAISEVLAFSGPPIRQPVAMGGPMVMNTRA